MISVIIRYDSIRPDLLVREIMEKHRYKLAHCEYEHYSKGCYEFSVECKEYPHQIADIEKIIAPYV